MGKNGNKGEIIIYKADDGKAAIDVRLEQETVWLTQAQIAILFDKDARTISEHLANVYSEKELRKGATIRKVRLEGTISGPKNILSLPNASIGSPEFWMPAYNPRA